MNFTIHKITDKDKNWVLEITRQWGADFIVSRGRKIYPVEIEGYFAQDNNGKRIGMVTYEVTDNQCEIVTLDAFEKFQGIGTALLNTVIDKMKEKSVTRLWLITTNDNLDGIRFYQRRDWTMCKIHVDALEYSRKLKPAIPKIGLHGIPMRHEIEFEFLLD
jgi:N-acetylglutamate synthase-like GNAT family acetyltransferase